MRIYLIGLPGSGKTTVGKELAKKLKYQHLDLDSIIEAEALMFIDEIFSLYGEETFRSLETEALMKINVDNAVISCGGGIILKKENKTLMDGLKIYLDTDLDIIKSRLKLDYKRPILRSKTLEFLHDERFFKYQDFADKVVSNNYDVETTVNVLYRYLKEGSKA